MLTEEISTLTELLYCKTNLSNVSAITVPHPPHNLLIKFVARFWLLSELRIDALMKNGSTLIGYIGYHLMYNL